MRNANIFLVSSFDKKSLSMDAHMPCVCVDKPEAAVKVVVKIPVTMDK